MISSAVLSHRKFESSLIDSFHKQQAFINNVLLDNFNSFLTSSLQALHSIELNLQLDNDLENVRQFGRDIFQQHMDHFYAIVIYRDQQRLLQFEPPLNNITLFDLDAADQYLHSATITDFPHISPRILNPDSSVALLLIDTFNGADANYTIVGVLRLSDYAKTHLSFLENRDNSFFLTNTQGEILSLYNTECEKPGFMKTGNIFSLEPGCLSCHQQDEFMYLKNDFRSSSVIHHVHHYSWGVSVNRSTNSVNMFNDRWLICVCTPYNSLQRLIINNAIFSATYSFVFIATFLVLCVLVARKQTKEKLLKAETENLKKIAFTSDALKQSENKHRSIIETMDEGYFEVDLAGNLTFFNAAFQKCLGYPEKELVGMNNRDYMKPGAAKYAYTKFNQVFRTGIPARNVEWHIITKSNEERIAESSVALIKNSQGKPIGFRGVLRDETERIRAKKELESSEQKFRTLSERLAQTNSMKDLLLDIITHDIKGPASAIHGFVELLLEKHGDSEELLLAYSGTKNLIGIVHNAAVLSKISQDKEIPIQLYSLGKELEYLIREFSSVHKNIEFENRIPDSFEVMANPVIIEIFQNYLSNAAKYASEGKRVILDWKKSDGSVTFSVEDYGITIAEADRKRIFKRGIQLSKTPGAGLGLAIVKKIAEAHRGKAWVEPNKPTGNQFRFQIPV